MLAYLDCFSGISGDMTIAALLDAGLDLDYLKENIALLGLTSYELKVWKSKRSGIEGTRFDVIVGDSHHHRGYTDIRNLIESSGIPDSPKVSALKTLDILAEAESVVHGVTKEEVHFHEVGAVDSIIDIVGVSLGMHWLGVDSVICSPLPMSRGFVDTAHGTIPTPAPAALEILRGAPVVSSQATIELVTPTGAAIARSFSQGFDNFPSFIPMKVGYGLGKSDPPGCLNALRIVLGRVESSTIHTDRVAVIQCHIDDLDPRVLGHVMDMLFEQGALDVTFQPLQMKKNRPGTLVSVICTLDQDSKLSEILLTHSTTIGVRVSYSSRYVLHRTLGKCATSFGEIRVKEVHLPNGDKEHRPEFDDIKDISKRTGLPCRDILSKIEAELRNSHSVLPLGDN
jgi:uncharacterized protein (TIGR00299 family) protein